MLLVAALALAAAAGWRAEALSVTVTDTECIHEFVPYEGDSVTGNFVVVDHDIFWSSDHPGIDLTVRYPGRSPASSRLGFNLPARSGHAGLDLAGFMRCFSWDLGIKLGIKWIWGLLV
jgi:hypothetical protein